MREMKNMIRFYERNKNIVDGLIEEYRENKVKVSGKYVVVSFLTEEQPSDGEFSRYYLNLVYLTWEEFRIYNRMIEQDNYHYWDTLLEKIKLLCPYLNNDSVRIIYKPIQIELIYKTDLKASKVLYSSYNEYIQFLSKVNEHKMKVNPKNNTFYVKQWNLETKNEADSGEC